MRKHRAVTLPCGLPHKKLYRRNFSIKVVSEYSHTSNIGARQLRLHSAGGDTPHKEQYRRNIPIRITSQCSGCAFNQGAAARRNYKEIAKKHSHTRNIGAQQYAFNQGAETLRIKSNCEETFLYGLHRSVAVAPLISRRRLAARIFAPSFSYCRVWKSGGSKERKQTAANFAKSLSPIF